MEILVVGGGCADCDKMYSEVQAAVEELGLQATVRKVEDLVEMVRLGVMSVPALMADGRMLSAGRRLSKKQIMALLAGK